MLGANSNVLSDIIHLLEEVALKNARITGRS